MVVFDILLILNSLQQTPQSEGYIQSRQSSANVYCKSSYTSFL